MNPFGYMLRSSSNPYGFYTLRTPSTFERVDGRLEFGTNMEPRGISQSDRDRTDAEANLAVLLELKQQRVNVGVTLGERRETSSLILDAAKRIGTSLRAIKRGDIKGAIDAVSNGADAKNILRELQRVSRRNASKKPRANKFSVSNEVLVVQLGWKPLLSDIHNYAELLASKANDPIVTKVSTSRSFRWSGPFGAEEQWFGVNSRRKEFGIHSVKYVLYFSTTNEFNKTLAELGISNPASWLWELATLSFVVDWAIRIGDFIDALDATTGLTFEKGCKTVFEKCKVKYDCVGTGIAFGGESQVNGTAHKTHVDVSRGVLTSFPAVPPPLLGRGLSFSRGLTAGALIRQYLKK
jgi:hypothetical protein